jgi:hypothetical protein
MDAMFDQGNYPGNIIESVHSDIPGDPEIKIRFAGTEEEDDDATISVDTENEDQDDDDDDDLPIRKKKSSKSKTEDIHSFL